MLGGGPLLRDDGTPRGLLWPVPIPYPEAFRGGSGEDLWKKRRLCVQLMVLDWLHLGRPAAAPGRLRLGQKLTSGQWRIVRLFEVLAEDGNSVQKVDAAGMGRTASKVESQDEELGALHRAMVQLQNAGGLYDGHAGLRKERKCAADKVNGEEVWDRKHEVVGHSSSSGFVAAKPLVADRIKFGPAPKFDPLPYMDSQTARMYLEPGLFLRADPEEPPRVSVRATADEKLRLYAKMAACDRLKMLRLDEVDETYASGLFGVVKDFERDRLIMDSRPPNSRELGLNHWCACLANAALLGGIELDDGEDLRMSGQDIKDYFYQFVVGESRCRRNALVGRLEKNELEKIFPGAAVPQEGGYVALSTMAMGDLCAVEFAQCSHLSLLLQSGMVQAHELLRGQAVMPKSPMMIGLVIDDLVLLEKVNRKCNLEDTEAKRRMPGILKQYEKVGLPTNPSKEFVNSTCASFWGAEVDGKAGIVRPNSSRLWPLTLITMRVCCLGVVSISLLESLCGSWISIFLFRRRCLSCMNEIFEVLHGGGYSGNDIIRLNKTLADELFALAVLGSLCYVNLRAKCLETFRATDASDWGMAAVSADLPLPVVREGFRFSLTRSLWTKLLPPGKAWLRQKELLAVGDELPDEDPYDCHPLWEVFGRCLEFREEWRRPHQRQVHINVAELKAHLVEEENLCKKHQSFRCLYGLDSQVALGCLVKGRSASRSLNGLLSRSLGPMLGSDAYGGYGFLPSAINRADDPTRNREVEKPSLEKPVWWTPLAEHGNDDAFDVWIQELGKAFDGARDEHDFSSLGYKEPLKLQTGKQERASEFFRKACNGHQSSPPSADKTDACTEKPANSCGELRREVLELLEKLDGNGQILWAKNAVRGDFSRPGALDLFTGRGGVARQLLRMGCPFVITYEWLHSPSEDLLQDHVRADVMKLIEEKAVLVCGSALICKSFSRAITPAIRSARFVKGVPWAPESLKQSLREGNSHAAFAVRVIAACEKCGLLFWLENPDGSFLWLQPGMKRRFSCPSSLDLLRVDYCRFGTPWRKRTRVATNCEALRGLRLLCRCREKGKVHIPLRGMHPLLKKPWTAVAEPYPRGFCSLVAGGLASDLGWSKKLNIAGCCRSNSLRIGEAKNPGPRRPRAPRFGTLEDMPQQLGASVALGEKCWRAFYEWAEHEIGGDIEPLKLFLMVPLFLAYAIRKFGDLLFTSGGALLYYRHLILAAQLKSPNVKQYVHICWDLAGRWELAEPVTHRTPVPFPLVQCMVSTSFLLGWTRWAGVTLLCFHGIARVGEVLRCRRRDLLLPGDLLEAEEKSAYLVLMTSKTSRRQAARVQHLKITDVYVVKLLVKIFGEDPKDALLFSGSPSAYRSRWDHLLRLAEVPNTARLTPGGLRGGGAVESYRRGVAISELVWRMRLKNQSTLESYLQEVAALSALVDLPADSLTAIRAGARLYPHLCRASMLRE